MADWNAPAMEGTTGAVKSMTAVGQDAGVINPGTPERGVIKFEDTELVGEMIACTLVNKHKTAIIAEQTVIPFNNLIF